MNNKRIQTVSHSFKKKTTTGSCSADQKEFVFKKTQNEMSPKLILKMEMSQVYYIVFVHLFLIDHPSIFLFFVPPSMHLYLSPELLEIKLCPHIFGFSEVLHKVKTHLPGREMQEVEGCQLP